MSPVQRLMATLRSLVPTRNKLRDPRPRPAYYDGSERADLTPPTRYARGQRAVPAPPPTGL